MHCELDSGDYALVEMQVVPQNYWDRRALAYAANIYGSQLRKGGKWKDLKKVIYVNILGGGREGKRHWVKDRDFMRHYKFQDQFCQGKKRFIDGIKLIQYSIMNDPTIPLDSQEKKDWLTFFRDAHSTVVSIVVNTHKNVNHT